MQQRLRLLLMVEIRGGAFPPLRKEIDKYGV